MLLKILSICLMSFFLYLYWHKTFLDPYWFMQIMPPYLPFHRQLVYISGAFEILFGILLLFEKSRFYASWGLDIVIDLCFPC